MSFTHPAAVPIWASVFCASDGLERPVAKEADVASSPRANSPSAQPIIDLNQEIFESERIDMIIKMLKSKIMNNHYLLATCAK